MSEHRIISKPKAGSYPEEAELYIRVVPSNDLLGYFDSQKESVATVAAGLSEDQLLYRYAKGKWSVKDIFSHITDCERIYCYRSLCIARGEKQSLPGFEENDYAREANADKRNIESIISEYKTVRASTIELFKSFTDEMLNRVGIANESPRSIRAMGYITAGHEIHHLNVIKERYIQK